MKINLAKQLHKHNVQAAILNSNESNLQYSQPEEQTLFIVDSNCPGFEDILRQVFFAFKEIKNIY